MVVAGIADQLTTSAGHGQSAAVVSSAGIAGYLCHWERTVLDISRRWEQRWDRGTSCVTGITPADRLAAVAGRWQSVRFVVILSTAFGCRGSMCLLGLVAVGCRGVRSGGLAWGLSMVGFDCVGSALSSWTLLLIRLWRGGCRLTFDSHII